MFGPIWFFYFTGTPTVPPDTTLRRLRIGKRQIVEKVRT